MNYPRFEPKKNGDDPIPSKSATQMRTNNLPTVPTEPPRVVSTNQAEAAKEALKRNAPNQNKYVSYVAKRVSQRRKEEREARRRAGERVGQTRREDIAEKRREKSAKEKQSDRQAKFERRRNTKNPRKRKDNPGVKAPKPMQY